MPSDRPNVICILADDLGWRDLGCYGSSFYETPRLDELAREGARFSDAYASCPVCSPTRASVMTGNYPARVGVTDWIDFGGDTHPLRGKLVDAEYTDHLPHGETTLASTLSEAGYRSCHVGKWHLGGAEQDSRPEDHGFDTNVGGCEWGMPAGEGGYFQPWDIPTLEEGDGDGYLPERLTSEAEALIEATASSAEPLFLNYCPYLVHTPIQAPDGLVERYERKREKLGLDTVQEFEIGEHFPTEMKRHERIERRQVQSDPTYAAMVEMLDRCVGRIIDALERTGQLEETVILFSSDNGGLATTEGSPTTNRPLAEGKGWMVEGGNRVPLIVRWPGVTDQGPEFVETPVTSPDLYSTILDAAGVAAPESQGIDGHSLRPLLADRGGTLERDAIFWHYPHYGNQGGTPAAAVRSERWKLIQFFETDTVRLYDLDADVRERQDVSDRQPDVVENLRTQLTTWQDAVGAKFPAQNPDFEGWDERSDPYGAE